MVAKDLTLLLGGLATEHAFGDVTREDAREEIDERRHDQERADREHETLGDESQNQQFLSVGICLPPGPSQRAARAAGLLTAGGYVHWSWVRSNCTNWIEGT